MTQEKSSRWLLPKRAFGDCFGCAPHNTKGLKLRFWLTEEGCESYHAIPKEYCGFTGLVHGGIIATILDEVAAWTIITQFFRIGITAQAKVKYLKPVPTEEELIIKGNIREQTGKQIVVLSQITTKDSTVLAEAESKWLLPDKTMLQKLTGLTAEELNYIIDEVVEPLKKIRSES